MPKLSSSRTVAFPVSRIYGAVLDVESYPRLLPFIRSVRILAREEGRMRARVEVGLPGLSFAYECAITFAEDRFVHIHLLSGPFRKLEAHWEFTAVGPGHTRIDYALDSQFSNPLMEMTAGAIFASQLHQAIAAFESHLKRS